MLPTIVHFCLAANYLAYTVEYRKTNHHGNTDVLSRLPSSLNFQFYEDEIDADYDTVCTVKTICRQIDSSDPMIVTKQ